MTSDRRIGRSPFDGLTTAVVGAHHARVRIRVATGVMFAALTAALSTTALADGDSLWRATSPRVHLGAATDQRLELVIPAGRARGATSRVIALEPGGTYLAAARLELDSLVGRGAFLRVALYASERGSGRQRRRLDSAAVRQGTDGVTIVFEAPRWAHAAKVRLLARPDRDGATVTATDVTLIRIERSPVVVLRPDD